MANLYIVGYEAGKVEEGPCTWCGSHLQVGDRAVTHAGEIYCSSTCAEWAKAHEEETVHQVRVSNGRRF